MRVLVACEFSGTVRDAFRARGHDAWSCDLMPSERPSPFHWRGDLFELLEDTISDPEFWPPFDLIIAHPPCTHLAVSGAKHFKEKRANGKQKAGIELFMRFTDLPAPLVCIENPIGIMSRLWREPDQIIQPFHFGDEAQKTTCLWLKNLPPLIHIGEDDLFDQKTHVGKGEFVVTPSGKKLPKWYSSASAKTRSKTFPGIAQAMADQWGAL